MLRRWDVRVCDVGLMMAVLDQVLASMGLDSRFRGRRSSNLYVKVLVLKEVFKASLRYAEGLSLTYFGVRVPKSTLHYWELRHGDVVGVLRILLRCLCHMEYDYSVMDSTKLTDWMKGLHELFACVRVKGGSTLFPVHAEATVSEVKFLKGVPEGRGLMLADGVFDAKPSVEL